MPPMIEGEGRKAPIPELVLIGSGDWDYIRSSARARSKYRKYAAAIDPWKRGLNPEGIAWGCAGELATANVLTRILHVPAYVDWALYTEGDGGRDIILPSTPLVLQVKTVKRGNELLIRRFKERGKIVNLIADIYFFCNYTRDNLHYIEVLGWITRQMIYNYASLEKSHVPNAQHWNLVVPHDRLFPMSDIHYALGTDPVLSDYWGILRYPGAKERLWKQLRRYMPIWSTGPLFVPKCVEYREPFFGSGKVGKYFIQSIRNRDSRIWLNDKNWGIACLWNAVCQCPDGLIDQIRSFKPSPEAFYEFQEHEASGVWRRMDPVRVGFEKVALHRLSWGGLGGMAGGPLGGANQRSEYNIEVRWNPPKLICAILQWHNLLSSLPNLRITSYDFSRLFEDCHQDTFMYLDPPYVAKGEELYYESMEESDHRRLAQCLEQYPGEWVLSYDDHPLVRELYGGWSNISGYGVQYSTATARGQLRATKTELAITKQRPSVSGRSVHDLVLRSSA